MEQIPINYTEFGCRNIAAIKSFYSEAFGWTFTDYGAEYIAFNDGKNEGGFFVNAQFVAAGNPLVVLYAAHLEEALLRVSHAGGVIVKEIFAFPGGRRFHFTDPDGNVLAVWGA